MITYFESTDQQVVAFEMGNGDAIYLVNLGNETVKDIQVVPRSIETGLPGALFFRRTTLRFTPRCNPIKMI